MQIYESVMTDVAENATTSELLAKVAAVEDLSPSERALVAEILGAPPGDAGGPAPAWSFRERTANLFARLLTKRADRPTLLLVDDAERLHPAVLDALEFATSREVSRPLAVVAAATPWRYARSSFGA